MRDSFDMTNSMVLAYVESRDTPQLRAHCEAYHEEVSQEFNLVSMSYGANPDFTNEELLRIAQANVKRGRNHERLLDAAERYAKCKKQDEEREERKRKRAVDSGVRVFWTSTCSASSCKQFTKEMDSKQARVGETRFPPASGWLLRCTRAPSSRLPVDLLYTR